MVRSTIFGNTMCRRASQCVNCRAPERPRTSARLRYRSPVCICCDTVIILQNIDRMRVSENTCTAKKHRFVRGLGPMQKPMPIRHCILKVLRPIRSFYCPRSELCVLRFDVHSSASRLRLRTYHRFFATLTFLIHCCDDADMNYFFRY